MTDYRQAGAGGATVKRADEGRRKENVPRRQVRREPPADSGDDEELGPGRATDPAKWEALWARLGGDLEDVSRAMAAELRHGKSKDASLALPDCRALANNKNGKWFAASDILLITTCSLRTNGEPRFKMMRPADDMTTVRIAAVPKSRENTTSAAWTNGPPPKSSTRKEELDAQFDAWQGRAAGSADTPRAKTSAAAARAEGRRDVPAE